MSEMAYSTDTRFGRAADLVSRAEQISGRAAVYTIEDAEPLGPTSPLDALIIAPCTGNTLSKIANGITDTSVTMAAKAHLRCDRPTLIALASNDALSQNLQNISKIMTRKSVFFVPMLQDSPKSKPHSLVADFSLIIPALSAMEDGRQLRPIFK
jgi:dipicolinate synthase subunit B